MFRWLAGRGASRRQVARMLDRIDNHSWSATLSRYPFLMGLSSEENQALRERTAWILASKAFSGAQGLVLTDEITLSIAVQAALPILKLHPVLYEGWTEIIVYPGGFLIPCADVDDAGVVHEYVQEASGQAWEGGPVILSWEAAGPYEAGYTNVVIHEFAHQLDLRAGHADGMPDLSDHSQLDISRWVVVRDAAFQQFSSALKRVEDAIPSDIDPESDDAAPWFDRLPMDPYAAYDTAEFFAVSTEALFVNPEPLAAALPEWYALLAQYYRQDPLTRLGQGSGTAARSHE